MQNHTDEIIARFPQLTCSVLNGGVNVYYHKYVITIWWRKQSYCDTKKHKWVRFTSLEAIIEVIDSAAYPKEKKVPVIAPVEVINEKEAMQPIDIGLISVPMIQHHIHYGVNQCIDHIQHKIEYGESQNLSNSNLAMLKTLLSELMQYL